MSLLVLAAQDVQAITSDLKLDELEALMASVFHRLSSGSGFTSPHRTSISMARHTTLFMPARVADIGTTMKVVSVPTSREDKQGLPASTIVLDEMTGCVKAIVNASTLTALRTAAGSLLATRLLISKQPINLVAFGAGKQIEAHIDLHLRGFPSLKQCTIVNRALNTRLQTLLASLRLSHPTVSFVTFSLDDTDKHNVEKAVRQADIICTATSAVEPLFPSDWVSPGTHLNLVGSFTPNMHEIDSELIRRVAGVVVDSREACAVEAGELITAEVPKESMIEIGELVEKLDDGTFVPTAKCEEAKASGTVTIFKSVGVGIQDVAIANLVVSRAEQWLKGTRIDSYH